MTSAAASACHRVLSTELLPTLRRLVDSLGGDGPESLVHARPTPEGSGRPTNSVAVLVRHLVGVTTAWGAAALGGADAHRDRAAEFDFTGEVLPQLDRLGELVDLVPDWADAAEARGGPREPAGSTRSVGEIGGGYTVDWVLAHLLHEFAAHVGHAEITRDVLLART